MNQSALDRIVNSLLTKKYIYGAVFHVSSGEAGLISAAGEMQEDSRYYIASINKLFVSSLILKLHTENKLDLQDKISKHLPGEVLQRLHVYRGKEFSRDLTLLHLLSHTSGLPCYLIDKQADGRTAMRELEAGIDQPWPVHKVLYEVKRMKTHFPPGKKGRAKYVDTNHQILGLVLENMTGEPVNAALSNLFQKLGLTGTSVCGDTADTDFVPIRYKEKVLHLPLFLSSTQNDIVSTAKDQMTFLQAFFSGYFYPKEKLNELEKWNSIFFPFEYGIGIQKFSLPRMLSLFHPVPDMLGHCGSTGSVAFYVPDRDLYITGTVNQQARPNTAFQTMIRILRYME